ncbi:alpha-amylase family glycosyl hydrolase [Mahella sp.]|uniref:alpha-amylase family glycosyl hydrolase n=1 Tax=Mahella sp. TaxID=2798721 RepID=UPI0025C644E2|nr:alpha-amylase family glycosyl hydrolase [Mahella sp.]MBZ4665962.1 alpha-amlyase [Mahella sp.]
MIPNNVIEFEDMVFTDAGMLANFLDNHDVPRFVNQAGENSIKKLKAALTYLMTTRGIPVIYYGTEAAMNGGADPDNRRDMDWNEEPVLAEYLKQLSGIRRENSAFTHGDYISLEGNVVGFIRKDGDEYAIVFINNTDKIVDETFDLPNDLGIKDGKLKDSISGVSHIDINGNKVQVKLDPYQTAIYEP